MAELQIGPGRWLVEVREDGGHTISRINDAEIAHGGDGPDLYLPGVHAWFDRMRSFGPPDDDGFDDL